MRSTVKEKPLLLDLGDRVRSCMKKRGWKTSEKRHQLAGVLKDELMFAGSREVTPGRGNGMINGAELKNIG